MAENFEGVVVKSLRDAMFNIKLDSGHIVLGRLSGKIRQHKVRVSLGDRVIVELNPYGVNKDGQNQGKIIQRLKSNDKG